jgi:hypothetical protein
MLYRGRYFQGTEIPLGVQVVDVNSVPTAPDAAPTMDVFSPSGKAISGKAIPAVEKAILTGLFYYKLFLGPLYSPGLYSVSYRWTTGGGAFLGMDVDTFEVLPGGNAKGCAISLAYIDRPQAKFIIQQWDSGRLRKNRNPRL